MNRRELLKSLLTPLVAPAAVGVKALLPDEAGLVDDSTDARRREVEWYGLYHPDRKKVFGEHGLMDEHMAELRRNCVEYTGWTESPDGCKWATWRLRK